MSSNQIVYLVTIAIIAIAAPPFITGFLTYNGMSWPWYQTFIYTISPTAVGTFAAFIIPYITEQFEAYSEHLDKHKEKLRYLNSEFKKMKKEVIEINKLLTKKTKKK